MRQFDLCQFIPTDSLNLDKVQQKDMKTNK